MELITNRTESDVFLGNEKGVYCFSDLNRVESAVQEIAALFPVLGTSLVLVTKTDWGLPESFSTAQWPVESQMRRYLGNIDAIKKLFYISVPLPASMEKLNWNGANNIEKTLQQAKIRAANTIQTFRYSGEIYSGEE